MKHRDFTVMVDGPSRSRPADTRHRADSAAVNAAMLREDIAYISWCSDRGVDSNHPDSAAQYERTVGLLYP